MVNMANSEKPDKKSDKVAFSSGSSLLVKKIYKRTGIHNHHNIVN